MILFQKLALFLISSSLFISGALAQTTTAKIKITPSSGYSNFVASTGSELPEIYGGFTGLHTDGNCPTASASETCNNCVDASGVPLGTACNLKRIHGNLQLVLSIEIVADLTGFINVAYDSNTTTNGNIPATISNTGEVKKGDTATITLNWSDICDIAGITTDCAYSGALTGGNLDIKISIEPSGENSFPTEKTQEIGVTAFSLVSATSINTITCATTDTNPGVCSFYAKPGDEKIVISDLDLRNTTSCDDIKGVRVYFSTAGFSQTGLGYLDYVDFNMKDDCEPDGDWIIDGLENEVPYALAVSMIDIAENNIFRTVDTEGGAGCTDPIDITKDASCAFIATPGNVVGLLNDDFNCFVATATYGSSFAHQVQALRDFRNQFLLKTKWGKSFVLKYYQYGPHLARYISDKPGLRWISRALITPFWLVAWLFVHAGWPMTLLLLMISIAAIFYFTKWGGRKFAKN